jgi:antitoxin (DNA-binding transcriptional repressor) of toxin-antitoxin stability system
MKEAKISQIRDHLSRYLDLVRQGEVVRILDRDIPIAHIVPIGAPGVPGPVGDETLAQLERRGLVRRGRGAIPREILDRDPAGRPVGAVDALLEERRRR